MQFSPLEYPEQWPPPEQPLLARHRLSWIPILGGVYQYFRWLKHFHAHLKDVLNPIADEIVSQLETRPNVGPWPTVPEQRQLALIISEAVCLQKELTHRPALHPDDPFPLLFWGPFDDLTPLTVSMKCREKLKVHVSHKIITDAWNERWTVQQFIEHLLPEPSEEKS